MPRYVGYIDLAEFILRPVIEKEDLMRSIEMFKALRREHMIDTYFRELVEKRHAG